MESAVQNDHLYRVPGCVVISKTTAIGNLMFELINDSLDDIVSP